MADTRRTADALWLFDALTGLETPVVVSVLSFSDSVLP